MRVVCVVAAAPGYQASLSGAALVGLTLDTALVNAVLADGAVLHLHVPAPKGDCVPLLNRDALVNFHSLNVDDYNSSTWVVNI